MTHDHDSRAIFNNTVINSFRVLADFKREASTDFVYEAPASSLNDGTFLLVECSGVQGDHQVIWTTDNQAVGNEDGVVNCDPRPNTQQIISNYSSRYARKLRWRLHELIVRGVICCTCRGKKIVKFRQI